ncbi:hypothetical protein H9L39_11599 [Fusarium oxysporum f. sp. albedinis]|nr:hypothetical protein H9L39_11599 [Fusarium oxysporum f. sp. albedinis]
MASVGPEAQCLITMVGKSWETRVGLGMTYFLASKSLRSSPSMLSLIMPRNFTYVLNQLRMDTMAQCTSPTLSNSMTNPVSDTNCQSFSCSDWRTANVLEGFAQLGLPVIGDLNNGTATGAMILPSSMQPDNQTRFDAREAHFNSASRRYNLHIATNQTVTRLVLDSNSAHNSSRRVMGVEFAPRNKSKARSISCTREVIVSAGAIFTPTLLQVSGIEPSDVLKSLDILVKIDLPGVGCNLQDHSMVYANYYYRNESYFRSNEIADGVYDEAAEEYIRNRTGPWTAPLINTIAFPSLRSATDDWKQFMNKSSGDGIPSNTPNSVKKGYEFQKKILQDQILSNDAGTFETMAIS